MPIPHASYSETIYGSNNSRWKDRVECSVRAEDGLIAGKVRESAHTHKRSPPSDRRSAALTSVMGKQRPPASTTDPEISNRITLCVHSCGIRTRSSRAYLL
jgi:hypothetical protein